MAQRPPQRRRRPAKRDDRGRRPGPRIRRRSAAAAGATIAIAPADAVRARVPARALARVPVRATAARRVGRAAARRSARASVTDDRPAAAVAAAAAVATATVAADRDRAAPAQREEGAISYRPTDRHSTPCCRSLSVRSSALLLCALSLSASHACTPLFFAAARHRTAAFPASLRPARITQLPCRVRFSQQHSVNLYAPR